MMARMTSDMEAYIVAVERINEYAELQEEVRRGQTPTMSIHPRLEFVRKSKV